MRQPQPSMRNQQPPHPRRTRRRLGMLAGGGTILAVCLLVRYYSGAEVATAETPRTGSPTAARRAAAGTERLEVVAHVNGEEIRRNELARYALWHYGKAVLESLVNKQLIAEHCQRHQVAVTDQEVEAEIDRVARRWGLGVEQWLKMLKDERNIAPEQYTRDIIWPMLALRKLAAAQLVVTPEELQRARESHYGPAVKARMIICDDAAKAEQVQAKARSNPEEFPNLAKDYSDDVNTASTKGLVQPIRRHAGDPQIERAAFALEPGQVSEVIQVGHQYVIVKCEERLPERTPPPNCDEVLSESIRESKLREAAGGVFKKLQDQAVVEIVYDDAEKSRRLPGVAAVINGRKITLAELAEECISRHGGEVLTGLIHRRVLEQACRERKIAISEQDEDAELAQMALLAGKVDAQGRPDVPALLKQIADEQGLAADIYVHDFVWPSVALKKLVGPGVTLEEDELKKGFEANYGPRVRCLAIVLNNMRQAQEVWQKARANPTAEHFGDLAEQYSVEASSKALRGEVRPIQRHGGQPALEKEAFALQPGEMSGIIQVGDKYVILRCQGHTTPAAVSFAEVRELLYEDLLEKKRRRAMAQEYDRLVESAQIANYLAGKSQAGKTVAAGAALRPGPQQVPLRR